MHVLKDRQRALGVLIVGYGLSGRIFHGAVLSSIPELYQIKGVITSSPEKAEQAIHDLPGLVVYSQDAYGEALSRPDVDLVIVSTPNETHGNLANQALRANKHVLIEKPFAPTALEGQQIVDVAKSANRFVSVYHNRQFDGDFMSLQQVVRSGLVGKIVGFESRFDRFRPNPKEGSWREEDRPGTGILYDLGSHLIDQARLLFGEPSSVRADVRKQRGQAAKADDGFELVFDYAVGSPGEGVKVTLASGSFVNYPTPRFVLLGDKGTYVHYGLDPQEPRLREGLRPHLVEAAGGVWGERESAAQGLFYRDNGQVETIKTLPGDYRMFFRRLHSAICSGDESLLPVSGEWALKTIQVIEQIKGI